MEVLSSGNFGDWSSSRENKRRGSVKKAMVVSSSQVLLTVNGAAAEGVGGAESALWAADERVSWTP